MSACASPSDSGVGQKRAKVVTSKVGRVVRTPQGRGKIVEFRTADRIYVVQLDWSLAEGSDGQPHPVYSFMQEADFTVESYDVGNEVVTPQGPGHIIAFRPEDQIYVVQLDWTLAEGMPVYSFLQSSDIRSNLYSVGTEVVTPQGVGVVTGYRFADDMYSVELHWRLAEGSDGQPLPAVSYLQEEDLLPGLQFPLGSHVITPQGPGQVCCYRPSDGIYGVVLAWSLAEGADGVACQVISYLSAEDLNTGAR